MTKKKEESKWTRFMDMHSGGGAKEKWEKIYIEAPQEEAEIIFYKRFGHNPNRVSCPCCGNDYSISEEESLQQATGYDRNCEFAYFNKEGKIIPQEEAWVRGKGAVEGCYSAYIEKQNERSMEIRIKCNTKDSEKWGLYISLKDYLQSKDVKIIYAKDIKPKERVGELPEQGYVWKD